jgi:hypothetical protein
VRRKRTVRTVELSIETEENVVLRGAGRRSIRMWCPDCHCEVEVVGAEEAAQIAGVSIRTIYRRVEAGAIHFFDDSGHTFICSQTLPRRDGAVRGK